MTLTSKDASATVLTILACGGIAHGHNGGGDGFTTSVYVLGDGDRVAVLLLNGRPTNSRGDGPRTTR